MKNQVAVEDVKNASRKITFLNDGETVSFELDGNKHPLIMTVKEVIGAVAYALENPWTNAPFGDCRITTTFPCSIVKGKYFWQPKETLKTQKVISIVAGNSEIYVLPRKLLKALKALK